MGIFIYPFLKNYEQQFDSKPELEEDKPEFNPNTDLGSQLLTTYLGREVWLPVRFTELDASTFPKDGDSPAGELLLPFVSITIGMRKNYVTTPLSQRKGSVHELYNIDDYPITIKGFVADLSTKKYPEKQLVALQNLWHTESAIGLDNALTNVFLDETEDYKKVIIKKLDFPAQKNGHKHMVPFTMTLESDQVFTLEDED